MDKKHRRVRIVHDGGLSARDMRVIDAETEELIRFVRRVEIVADAHDGGPVTALLYLNAPELDVTADADLRTEFPTDRALEERIAERVVARLREDLIRFREDEIVAAIDRAVDRKIRAAEKSRPPSAFLEGNGE